MKIFLFLLSFGFKLYGHQYKQRFWSFADLAKFFWSLNIKWKNLSETVFYTIFHVEKNIITGVCLWTKDSDPGDLKWPDPDTQHCCYVPCCSRHAETVYGSVISSTFPPSTDNIKPRGSENELLQSIAFFYSDRRASCYINSLREEEVSVSFLQQ